tara:strand:+ start:291 stop:758 length:468 start_codon:yes stop_codon:yes gene_type:complete
MNRNFVLNLLILISFFSLSFAYFVEFILGHEPCNLCKIERIPYIGALILSSLLLFIKKWGKIILFLILILFVFSTVVSVYHVGIEQGIFSESLLCELGGSNKIQNTDELLKTLENTPISCKEVTFTIFGLSLATFNAVLSMIISIILLKLIIKNE